MALDEKGRVHIVVADDITINEMVTASAEMLISIAAQVLQWKGEQGVRSMFDYIDKQVWLALEGKGATDVEDEKPQSETRSKGPLLN